MTEEFTLEKLIVNHKGKNIFDVTFVEVDRAPRSLLLSTVIIGVNGSGKSYLLTVIAEIFRALSSKKNGKDYTLKYESYFLQYKLNGSRYIIDISKNSANNVLRDKEPIDIKHVTLPSKILAVAYMVNDKFIFKASDTNTEDGYDYLGIRQASNATWTTSIGRRVCDALIEQSVDKSRNNKVKEILEFLGFDSRVKLVYEPNTKSLFIKKLSMKNLRARITQYSKSDDMRSTSIKKHQDPEGILNFVNSTSKKRDFITIGERKGLQYTLDFGGATTEPIYLNNDYYYLRGLIDIRLINSPKLILFKQGQEFDFEYASSGEKHLLFSLLNISSKIMKNSVVLIDEPELSLHPNWQMRYINYIKKLFIEFSSCHFLFATHSHYIISDLEHDSSSLVALSANFVDDVDRVAELIKYSTYAWSAENILYNIFQVRTTRNYYFEMDLRKLTKMIKDKSIDLESMSDLIKKLSKYSYDTHDPLNLILREAERYIEYGHLKKNEK